MLNFRDRSLSARVALQYVKSKDECTLVKQAYNYEGAMSLVLTNHMSGNQSGL